MASSRSFTSIFLSTAIGNRTSRHCRGSCAVLAPGMIRARNSITFSRVNSAGTLILLRQRLEPMVCTELNGRRCLITGGSETFHRLPIVAERTAAQLAQVTRQRVRAHFNLVRLVPAAHFCQLRARRGFVANANLAPTHRPVVSLNDRGASGNPIGRRSKGREESNSDAGRR